ncbi:MAG: type II toxin-antitoxin system RelE/ParE family toxin, partial [Candidatus Deferrimicrobiaceae bacterium]
PVMAYEVVLKPSAARELRKLPKPIQKRIGKKIDELGENPRPPDAKALANAEGFLRVRAGDYRIIYAVKDRMLIVLVVRIGHRRDIYRGITSRIPKEE